MKSGRLLLCLSLVIGGFWIAWRIGFAPPVRAQQPDAAATLKAEARLVLVDTIVTDKKGDYVHDLTQKDFKIWEDNKEQTIKSFSFEAEGSPSANPQAHYVVLFFDNSSMDFGQQGQARAAAKKFIDANASPNRLMAVVEFGGTLRVTQNFTASAERLKAAVSGVKSSAVASNAPPLDATIPSMPTAPAGIQVASLGAPPIGMPSLGNEEADFGARTVLLALRDLAKNLAAIPGRKTLVMLTAGFQLTAELQSELTATIDACNKYNVAVYPIDARGLVVMVPGPPGASLLLPRNANPTRVMNVTLQYSDDDEAQPRLILVQHTGGGGGPGGGGGHGGAPGGGTGSPGGGGTHGSPAPGGGNRGPTGTTGGTPGTHIGGPATPISSFYNPNYNPATLIPQIPPSATDNQQVLYALANGTGGFVILNTNDLLGGMEKIAKELSEYYILGYTPADTPEGICHTLRVKVDRGDTVVRSRTGYCNVKPADMLAGKPIEKELENQANGAQSGTIQGSIETPYFYTSANTARVNVAIDIAAGSIKFEKIKGKQHATLNVLGIAYKADNSAAARFSDSVDLDFDGKKEAEEFAKQPFHYENQFDVASGEYKLKVVFSSGGEAFGKLEIPLSVDAYDGKQFVLSSMALGKNVRRVSEMATGLDAELMEDHTPLVTRGMEIVPAASYRFKKSDNAVLYTELYEPLLTGSTPPQVAIDLKVVERNSGQAKFDTGLQNIGSFVQKGNPVIPIGMKLPVNTLDPGSYRAEMSAADSAGNKAKIRTADFDVE